MALINCPECNNKISDTASNCPYCGFKQIIHYCISCEIDNKARIRMNYNKDKHELLCPICGRIDKMATPEQEAKWAEQKRVEAIQNANKVTCPYCKSTNTKKITVGSKAVHTAMFGLWSISRNSKNYHCNKCDSDF